MTPELQSVVDRLDHLEREARATKRWASLAVLVAAAATAAAWWPSRTAAPAAPIARHSVIEANRFVLRDANGRAAGGLEVDRAGTVRLVLGGGYGTTGAAFLEVQANGVTHLTLRGPDGGVRAALLGTRTPSLALSPGGDRSSVALGTRDDGSGSIVLTDARGRLRFRAP